METQQIQPDIPEMVDVIVTYQKAKRAGDDAAAIGKFIGGLCTTQAECDEGERLCLALISSVMDLGREAERFERSRSAMSETQTGIHVELTD